MKSEIEIILNVSAIIFGFTIAFFHSWAYSSSEPYEKKHLYFLIPMFLAEIVLGTTIVMALIPSIRSFVKSYAPFLIGLALFMLILAKLLSIKTEWRKTSNKANSADAKSRAAD